jgi:hypothetical protein
VLFPISATSPFTDEPSHRRKTPHLPLGTRRAATDEKSRDAVALDRARAIVKTKGIDSKSQRKIERLLARTRFAIPLEKDAPIGMDGNGILALSGAFQRMVIMARRIHFEWDGEHVIRGRQ